MYLIFFTQINGNKQYLFYLKILIPLETVFTWVIWWKLI